MYENCSRILSAGQSTGDGLYLIDPDGDGPIAPADTYCDMTTDGGGWTLTYEIRNDVPDIADPWWGMVDIGSGDMFPAAPTPVPSGMHFVGPVRETRYTYWSRGGTTIRVTLIDNTTAAVVVDFRTIDTGAATGAAASGQPGSGPTSGCRTGIPDGVILSAAASTGFAAGDTEHECMNIGGADADTIAQTGTGSARLAVLGDSSIGGDTTTLLWVRH